MLHPGFIQKHPCNAGAAWHFFGMSTDWQIDEEILQKADQVTGRLGTSTQELVRLFVTQIANTGRVPIKLNANDELLDVARRNAILLSLDDSEGW